MCYSLWYNAPTMLPATGRQHRACLKQHTTGRVHPPASVARYIRDSAQSFGNWTGFQSNDSDYAALSNEPIDCLPPPPKKKSIHLRAEKHIQSPKCSPIWNNKQCTKFRTPVTHTVYISS